MVQMLSGLLDYGEVQDGRFRLKSEPFGLAALAEAVRDTLRAEGAGAAAVTVLPGAPERVHGDLDRLRQIFVHLALYMLEGRDPADGRAQLRPRRREPHRRDRASPRRRIRSTGSSTCSWA